MVLTEELSIQEVFGELGSMDQTPIQHDMPVETTLEASGVKHARNSTVGEAADYSHSTVPVVEFSN